jgi:hypothetical protein
MGTLQIFYLVLLVKCAPKFKVTPQLFKANAGKYTHAASYSDTILLRIEFANSSTKSIHVHYMFSFRPLLLPVFYKLAISLRETHVKRTNCDSYIDKSMLQTIICKISRCLIPRLSGYRFQPNKRFNRIFESI